jgi:hypothetical protein
MKCLRTVQRFPVQLIHHYFHCMLTLSNLPSLPQEVPKNSRSLGCDLRLKGLAQSYEFI